MFERFQIVPEPESCILECTIHKHNIYLSAIEKQTLFLVQQPLDKWSNNFCVFSIQMDSEIMN